MYIRLQCTGLCKCDYTDPEKERLSWIISVGFKTNASALREGGRREGPIHKEAMQPLNQEATRLVWRRNQGAFRKEFKEHSEGNWPEPLEGVVLWVKVCTLTQKNQFQIPDFQNFQWLTVLFWAIKLQLIGCVLQKILGPWTLLTKSQGITSAGQPVCVLCSLETKLQPFMKFSKILRSLPAIFPGYFFFFIRKRKESEKAIIKKSENTETPTVLRSGCGLR